MNKKLSAKKIAAAAILFAMTVVLSSFSIPVPGGHLYLCDTTICLAALIFDPVLAFIVGGFGSFLGDFLFYPTPMFVSLATHGLQAVVISLIAYFSRKSGRKFLGIVAVAVGAVIMVTGYTLGRAFIYASPEIALLKLPFEILQAVFGAVTGYILYGVLYKRKLISDLLFGQMKDK